MFWLTNLHSSALARKNESVKTHFYRFYARRNCMVSKRIHVDMGECDVPMNEEREGCLESVLALRGGGLGMRKYRERNGKLRKYHEIIVIV